MSTGNKHDSGAAQGARRATEQAPESSRAGAGRWFGYPDIGNGKPAFMPEPAGRVEQNSARRAPTKPRHMASCLFLRTVLGYWAVPHSTKEPKSFTSRHLERVVPFRPSSLITTTPKTRLRVPRHAPRCAARPVLAD